MTSLQFRGALQGLVDESEKIQKKEKELELDQRLFSEKLQGFLRENGLTENFTLPQLAQWAIRKSQ